MVTWPASPVHDSCEVCAFIACVFVADEPLFQPEMLTAVVSSLELCPKLVLPVVVESELILYLLIATFILFVDVSVCHLLLPSLHSSPFLCSPVPRPCPPPATYTCTYVRMYVCVSSTVRNSREGWTCLP